MQIELTDRYAAEKIKARTALMEVIDPELFVNVVDLGLIYDVEFGESSKVTVTMTLSTPHCPLGDAITTGVRNALEGSFPDREIAVNLVWEPEWSPDSISDAGRAQLGID